MVQSLLCVLVKHTCILRGQYNSRGSDDTPADTLLWRQNTHTKGNKEQEKAWVSLGVFDGLFFNGSQLKQKLNMFLNIVCITFTGKIMHIQLQYKLFQLQPTQENILQSNVNTKQNN